MKTCGSCANAKPVPGNVMQRVCFGAPPQLLATSQGIQTFRPNVAINDPACGMFEPLEPAEPANGAFSAWQPRPIKLTDDLEETIDPAGIDEPSRVE